MAKSTLPANFKDDVLASSMGGKRRYKLIHNSDGTVSLEDATTYTQVGSNFGASQVNATNEAVNASLATDGNASNVVNTFSRASARSNLSTGEKLSVSLGKIMKWFADLKDAAFRGVANNLTTSSSGSSVLDAYQGYLLNSNKVNNSNIIDALADVKANTQSKKPAGSLALKEAYNELNGRFAGTGIGDGVALIDKTSYTFPSDGYLVAKASYRQNYYVKFKIVGTNGKTTNEISIGSETTTNAITNNCVALYVKKGMGINSISKNSGEYNVIQFYPLV